MTDDLDVCYERSDENLERLSRALRALHARLRGVEDDVPFEPDVRALKAGDTFTFETAAGALDCIGTPAGTSGYGDLIADAVDMDIDGVSVKVASIDDLITMKRAAGRPQDRIALEVLGALLDEIEQRRGR